MRVLIVAVGKIKQGPEQELVDRYLKRAKPLGKSLGIKGFETIELAESRARSAATRKSEESEKILAAIPQGTKLIALDETGSTQSSRQFAASIVKNIEQGSKCMAFIIGGPDGLDKRILQNAQAVVSFSPLTWPHKIVRALLAEQLYRATTILGGHPYHRS